MDHVRKFRPLTLPVLGFNMLSAPAEAVNGGGLLFGIQARRSFCRRDAAAFASTLPHRAANGWNDA